MSKGPNASKIIEQYELKSKVKDSSIKAEENIHMGHGDINYHIHNYYDKGDKSNPETAEEQELLQTNPKTQEPNTSSNEHCQQEESRKRSLLILISVLGIVMVGAIVAVVVIVMTQPIENEDNKNSNVTDYSQCGQAGDVGSVKEQARIRRDVTGAINATAHSWPWHVLITKDNHILSQVYNPYDNYITSGSLINNQWVLTAAHTFSTDKTVPGWEHEYFLTFGLHKRPESQSEILPPEVQLYSAGLVVLHPRYQDYDYDIALVKLGSKFIQSTTGSFLPTSMAGYVNYTAYIRPVCLPCMKDNCLSKYLIQQGLITNDVIPEVRCEMETKAILENDVDSADKPVLSVVTGFTLGYELWTDSFPILSEPVYSPVLLQGLLNIRETKYCRQFVIHSGDIAFTPPNTTICATSIIADENVNSCVGETGGPLVREVAYYDEDNEVKCWVQAGIVVTGECEKLEMDGRESPSFYTNVMLQMDWIKMTMSVNND